MRGGTPETVLAFVVPNETDVALLGFGHRDTLLGSLSESFTLPLLRDQ
jgi:hypothetical protein